MDRRLKLDEELRDVLQNVLGYVNLYFQPPASVKMKYDCIRYSEETMNVTSADSMKYLVRKRYEVIVITRDPDSALPRAVLDRFEYCSPGRKYTADNLYHYPFTIYY